MSAHYEENINIGAFMRDIKEYVARNPDVPLSIDVYTLRFAEKLCTAMEGEGFDISSECVHGPYASGYRISCLFEGVKKPRKNEL